LKLGLRKCAGGSFFVTNWHEFCSLLNTGVKTQVTDPQKRVVNAPVGAKTQRKICENALVVAETRQRENATKNLRPSSSR